MAEEEAMENQNALQRVMVNAAADAAYRSYLLAEPHKAIEKALGTAPPPSLRIRFLEKPSHLDALVVLPDVVPAAEELSLLELQASECFPLWTCYCTSLCTIVTHDDC
jgi:hypothetical protein